MNDHGRISAWLMVVIVGVCLLVLGAAFIGILDALIARVVDLFSSIT